MQGGSGRTPQRPSGAPPRSASVSAVAFPGTLDFNPVKLAGATLRTVSAGTVPGEASARPGKRPAATPLSALESPADLKSSVRAVARQMGTPSMVPETSSPPPRRKSQFGYRGYGVMTTWASRMCVARSQHCDKIATRRCLSCEEYRCYDHALFCENCYIVNHVRHCCCTPCCWTKTVKFIPDVLLFIRWRT